MSNELARTILALKTEGARIVYGEATAVNTVALEGAATAVVLPALTPVVAGDYCAVLQQGADRLILGPVGAPSPRLQFEGTWAAATPATSFTTMSLSLPASTNIGFSFPSTAVPNAPRSGWYAYSSLVAVDRDCGWLIHLAKVGSRAIFTTELSTTARAREISASGIVYMAAGERLDIIVQAQASCIVGGASSRFSLISQFE